jgi:poly(beta-D-mannuronate) lyase
MLMKSFTFGFPLSRLALWLAFVGCGAFASAGAGEVVYRTESELHAALGQAKPGDTVVIGRGVWKDLAIRWQASGTEAQPVTLRAEEPGQVVLTGQSSLRLGGDYQVVSGLVFRDGYAPKGAVIEFRIDEKNVANHSRVTNCAIDQYNVPNRQTDTKWVLFYGRHNRLDHCYLGGKTNEGPAVVVELNDERHRQNFHLIDHNHFGYRPVLGSNGGETIRIGVSTFCTFSSNTVIERNFFEHCDGEVEIISVKSCDNIVRENVFWESQGVLAMRHGDRNQAVGNFFIGNHRPNTGGIRIVNESHVIRDNHLQDLRGERFFGTLAVMNGVPNSAQNRYMPVRDVLFTGNRFFNSMPVEIGVGRDNERTVPPVGCRFENNLLWHPEAQPAYRATDSAAGFTFAGNQVSLGGRAPAEPGFALTTVRYEKNADGLYAGGDYQPKLPVKRAECGPSWYTPRPAPGAQRSAGRTIPVSPGMDTLTRAVAAAQPGDTLELTPGGDYPVGGSLAVRRALEVRTPPRSVGRATVRVVNNKAERPIIELENGASLTIAGLRLDGLSEGGVAAAGIATWGRPMSDAVTVRATDCDFVNFNSARYNAFVMHKGTFADTVSFTNCRFENISGNALNLQAETDDTGRYNAERVILQNCLFRNVMSAALDPYRGSNDESTTGPLLRVDRCTFINVNNVELGSVLRLTGVQDGDVRNSLFVDSGQSGRAVKMEDQRWCRMLVSHVNLTRSGRIESFYPDRRGPGITELPTDFVDAAKGDFRLAAGSPLLTLASDGGALGARWMDGVLRE